MHFSKLAFGLASLIASAATATQSWTTLYDDIDAGLTVAIDSSSLRRGSDGLVYYMDQTNLRRAVRAADCSSRVTYLVRLPDRMGEIDLPNWRSSPTTVEPGSTGEIAFNYACANAR